MHDTSMTFLVIRMTRARSATPTDKQPQVRPLIRRRTDSPLRAVALSEPEAWRPSDLWSMLHRLA